MKLHLDNLRMGLGIVGATLGALWGNLGVSVQILLLLMAIDYAAAVLLALIEGAWSRDVALRGLARKVLVMLVVAAATAVSPILADAPTGPAAATAYAVVELLSVLKHARRAGVPVPRALLDAAEKLRAAIGMNNRNGTPPGEVAHG